MFFSTSKLIQSEVLRKRIVYKQTIGMIRILQYHIKEISTILWLIVMEIFSLEKSSQNWLEIV